MSDDHSRPSRRKLVARIWLAVIFLLLRGADVLLVWFAFHPFNPWPSLRGLAIGSALGSTALIIGLWQRSPWTRYILVTVIILTGLIFTLPYMILLNNPVAGDTQPKQAVLTGVVIYFLCAVPLIRSRKIHYLASSPASGGK